MSSEVPSVVIGVCPLLPHTVLVAAALNPTPAAVPVYGLFKRIFPSDSRVVKRLCKSGQFKGISSYPLCHISCHML